MEKQELLVKTKESLSSLETDNFVHFFQETTLQTILDNPLVLIALILVLFYALIKRSKFMLLFLFGTLSLLFLIRYTMPSPDKLLDLNHSLPFVGGCMGIVAVILYFMFIKSE